MSNNDFYSDMEKYIGDASKNTDRKLALYISSLTTLKDEEILTLFPDTTQLKNLADLIAIVKDATDHNRKVGEFLGNAQDLASVAITLLGKITSK